MVSFGISLDAWHKTDKAGADDGETASIIMTLRQKVKQSSEEVAQLQSKISSLEQNHRSEVSIRRTALDTTLTSRRKINSSTRSIP